MSNKKRGLLVVFIFIVSTMLISACEQSLSVAPVVTPTLLPDGLFVSPFPTGENPMDQIAEFAKQTAAAQTSVAGGTPAGTPQAISTVGTVITPQAGVTATPGVPTTAVPSTPTNAVPTTPVVAAVTTAAPTTPGVAPKEYVLQVGEFPYCIARRFNVDPDALISASNLVDPDVYYAGLKLIIPQGGAFPGSRMLASHPTTYTVGSADETVYSIACKFGDVDPAAIASANGISASASLTAGQALKIP